MNGKTLEKNYKEKWSGFREYEVVESNIFEEGAFVFPENIGTNVSLDEVLMPDGEFWTLLTNKEKQGKKGALIAMIKGTKSKFVVEKITEKISFKERLKIKEVTLDFANNMDWIARQIAPQALLTGDRFHAQKFVSDAVGNLRIKYRWEAIEKENEAILEAKKNKVKYEAPRYENGDTEKQLLARSCHLLAKPAKKWKKSQIERSKILFREFPELKKAYNFSMYFRNMFEQKITREKAKKLFPRWHEGIEKTGIKELIVASQSVKNHQGKILNYFENRATNASAESFNAKIKLFIARTKGVTDFNFFLFRLIKYFASPKILNPIFY